MNCYNIYNEDFEFYGGDMQKCFSLPEYPCHTDMWDELASEKRPIVVYGMGNGADKLIRRFEKYGIKIADFFASDGFVRGHSFHGYQILSFSDIKKKYSDFVIVLSFASNRREVIDMLYEIDDNYEMYVPDMPVADECEYFDKEFYNENYAKILLALNSFSDEKSRNNFCAILNYKLSGKLLYLRQATDTKEYMYGLIKMQSIANIIDAGAYNGDTLREAKLHFDNLKTAVAIEPDVRNFKKLAKYCEAEEEICIKAINGAAWNVEGDGDFSNSGNRNSSINSTSSFEHKTDTVKLVKIDIVSDVGTDYIKYDVEGAELEALEGSALTISRDKPALLISVYHRSRDVFELVNYIAEKYPFYKMYLLRLECIPAWEMNLIAVRKDATYE